ncbi:MAG TPA: sigma-E processing peptidase SpoIIGA [Thermaerobacter sp.]
MPYVYLDLFVLVNGVVDYVLLAVTAQVTQARTSRLRLWLAAAWGTAYACAVVLAPLPGLGRLPAVLLASACMLLIAFWPVTPRRLLVLAAWFYGLGCFVAGGAMALLSFLGGRGGAVSGLPLALLFSIAAAVAVGRSLWRMWRRRPGPGPLYVTLGLACEGRVVRLPALVDTGNQLRDPLTGTSVVVVEEAAVAPLLPHGLREAIAGGDDVVAWARAATACGWHDRLRIVPFASVGKERGFLAGFRPDALWLEPDAGAGGGTADRPGAAPGGSAPEGGGSGRRLLGPAIVAVFPGRFTGETHYAALLPTALLEHPGGGEPAAAWVS